MRNITFSAADELIDQARAKAKAKGVTLNDEFRAWLDAYVKHEAANEGQRRAARFREIMKELSHVRAGRKFTRDEMNER
jgi:hypothetical protein